MLLDHLNLKWNSSDYNHNTVHKHPIITEITLYKCIHVILAWLY